jgi:hypothetical protein
MACISYETVIEDGSLDSNLSLRVKAVFLLRMQAVLR